MTAPATTAAAIERLAHDVAALGRGRGLAEPSARIDEELRREDSGVARVVVVGEANRGKSSLVNALVGAGELSPVAPDITTSCHIVIRAGDETKAILHRRDGRAEEITVAEIADVATAAGSRSRLAKAVEVTIDSPLLRRGIMLVDTPGVGGLAAGHAEITRAALVEADAVLFVLDAESEVGAAEIAFLEQISERVGTVIFSFGKIDDYPAWRTLLDGTRSRLPARFADQPVIGVSSERRRRARQAEAAGDAERARELFERSGFAALEAELERSVIQRARQLRLWNVLATCRTTLDVLARQARAGVIASDPQLGARVKEANANVQNMDQAAAGAAQEVSLDLEGLRLKLVAEYDRRTVELERRYRERIQDWDDAFAVEFPDLLQSDLDALAGALHRILLEGVADIDRSVIERFGVEQTGVALDDEEQRLPLPQIQSQRIAHAPSAKLRRTQLLMMGGLGGGRLAMFGTEAAAGIVATAAVGTLTAGLAVAGAVVGLTIATIANRRIDRTQGRENAKQQATRLLSDAFAEARIQLQTPLSNRILTLRREFQADVEQRLKARKAELEALRNEVLSLSARAAAGRQAADTAAKARVAEVRVLQDRLTGLWDDLASDAIV